MNKYKDVLIKFRPFLLVLTLAIVYTACYFAPQFRGEKLFQYDVKHYEGMTQEVLETREKTAEDPQWIGSMFGGMPGYLVNVDYPGMILRNFSQWFSNLLEIPTAFIVFAILAMWLMLVMMGMNAYVAIAGAFMYGLSTYFFIIIDVGHLTKMWALAFVPLMIGSIHLTLRRNMWLGAALTALFAAVEIGAGHPQITYYFLLAMTIFWISEFVVAYREKRIINLMQRTGLLLVAGIFSLLANFTHFWYIVEHTPYTMRGGSVLAKEDGDTKGGGLEFDYATEAWSYGKAESLNLFIPDFSGRDTYNTLSVDGEVGQVLAPYGASNIATMLPTYWGEQAYTAGPVYMGAVVILLAIFGFMLLASREKWWMLIAMVLMLCLAWGNNFLWLTKLFFEYFPGYDKFRTVSMTLVVIELLLPLMAAMGIAKLLEMDLAIDQNRKTVKRALMTALISTGGLALCMFFAAPALFDFGYEESVRILLDNDFPIELAEQTSQALKNERAALTTADALRTLLYVLLGAGVLLAFLLSKISRSVFVTLLTIVAVADLTGVGLRFLSHDDFVPASKVRTTKTAADIEILKDTGEPGYRVFNLSVSPFNDASTSYFHRSVGGYHGAKMSRYQDLIDYYLNEGNPKILDMLNTRYLILPTEDGSQAIVQPRSSAFGAAWFVQSVEKVQTPLQEIELLDDVDLSRVAVVEESENLPKLDAFGQGNIEMTEYLPHRMTYKYKVDKDALAVFSEIYYPLGWTLYVDGNPIPYFRADYLLRAAILPSGEHVLEWRFRSRNWALVEAVSAISSLIILLAVLAFFARWVYGRYKQKNEAV